MAESGLVAGPVVEGFDVVEQDGSELAAGHGFPVAVDVSDLAFERCPGRFHSGVVPTHSGSSKGCRNA